jgi:sugar lactone lactonase YvrE
VALERRFAYLDLTSGDVEETGIEITADERVVVNDGMAVDGGVLFGTKHLEFNQPIAALYFLDTATKSVRTVLTGQLCSNGKYFRRDPQGVTLIDIDSIPKTIHEYRLDSRLTRVLDQRLITPPEALPGIPDGLRPAPSTGHAPEAASVIVAFYNPNPVSDGTAWQIRVADGQVLGEWLIPGSPRVTCPEFVEMEGTVKLVFTTAVEGMPEQIRRIAPGAGCLYIADTPFNRLPASPPLVPY